MLYHYTNLQGLLGILSGKSIWASHCEYLNDSSEYRQAIRFAKAFSGNIYMEDDYLAAFGWTVRDALEKMQVHDVYVSSFSEKKDLLSQWRGYCPQGGGVCIGFDKAAIQGFCDSKGYHLSKCIYSHSEQEKIISQLLDECFSNFPKPLISRSEYEARDSKGQVDHELGYRALVSLDDGKELADTVVNKFINEINNLAPRVKNFGFHEEAEWRIIAPNPENKIEFRTGSSHLIPYIQLPVFDSEKSPIREIIVGPNPNPQRCISSIEKLIKSFNLGKVEINESEIPFRSW